LKISARQMDRRLKSAKTQRHRRIYGRTKPGYLLKHHIPVKTDRWDVQTPGFTEVDLVSHSGNSASGEFAHTLNVTDMHTTWTESGAVLGCGEEAVQQALNQIAGCCPSAFWGWTDGPRTPLERVRACPPAWKSKSDSHFPTATTTEGHLRLHFNSNVSTT